MSHADLWSLADLQTPWCIHVVATLRVAEHIEAGAADIETLASTAGCDREALHSVLSYLVSKGVFEEPTPGQFALNETARGLLEPGARVSLDLDGIGGRMAYAWGTLLKYVRTGMPGYADVFGIPFWEDLDQHPNVGASFDALMGAAGHGTPDPDVLLRDEWSTIRNVVDVGGGNGSLLAEILKARPHLTGTLVDLPRAAAASAEVFQAAGVADRASAVAQSFFEALPGGADLYLLMKVLNDWPDRDAARILARCAEAARPNGQIVVCGGVSPEAAPAGLVIEMVLVGGRSRGLEQFGEMARDVGLRVVEAGQLRSGRFAVQLAPIS